MPSFEFLKPGDKIKRMLGGKPMQMIIIKVDENLITCDAITDSGGVFRGGWTFDRRTGAEEDHELEWGVHFGKTGSYLILEQ